MCLPSLLGHLAHLLSCEFCILARSNFRVVVDQAEGDQAMSALRTKLGLSYLDVSCEVNFLNRKLLLSGGMKCLAWGAAWF